MIIMIILKIKSTLIRGACTFCLLGQIITAAEREMALVGQGVPPRIERMIDVVFE